MTAHSPQYTQQLYDLSSLDGIAVSSRDPDLSFQNENKKSRKETKKKNTQLHVNRLLIRVDQPKIL